MCIGNNTSLLRIMRSAYHRNPRFSTLTPARSIVAAGQAMIEEAPRRTPVAAKVDVLVVGGGFTAIDCARLAVRHGAGEVRLVYRRARRDMPVRAAVSATDSSSSTSRRSTGSSSG